MGFDFKQKPQIEICGKAYECDISNINMMQAIIKTYPEIRNKLVDIQKFQDKVNALIAKKDQSPSALKTMQNYGDELLIKVNEALKACIEFIHGTVGEEEYAEIFKDKKKVNLNDHAELCAYIFEWALGSREKVKSKYKTKKPNPIVLEEIEK